MNKNQKDKTKFRRSNKWMNFRKRLKNERKVDAITESRLTPTFNLHHCDLNEEHYENISNEDNFICLNRMSHECVHFIFNAHNGWRNALKNLTEILELMDNINNNEK